jgi:tetratricopeptide (TPR) repeat protein
LAIGLLGVWAAPAPGADKAEAADAEVERQYNAQLERGSKRIYAGDADGALEAAEAAIALDPDRATAYRLSGDAWVKKSLFMPAEFAYDDAIKRHNAAVAENKPHRRDERIDQAYLMRGQVKCRLSNYEEAVSDCTRCIELTTDPDWKRFAYRIRGNIHVERRDFDAAIADYNQAIKLDPDDVEGYLHRGVAYTTMERHADAEKDFDRALALAPRSAKVYYYRAASHALRKNRAAALADLRMAVKYDPEDKEYREALATVEGSDAATFIGVAVAAVIIGNALGGGDDDAKAAAAEQPAAAQPKRLKRTVECTECNGSGDVRVLNIWHKCSECQGTGKVVHWMDKFLAGPGAK